MLVPSDFSILSHLQDDGNEAADPLFSRNSLHFREDSVQKRRIPNALEYLESAMHLLIADRVSFDE